MLRFDKATHLSLLVKFILSERLKKNISNLLNILKIYNLFHS